MYVGVRACLRVSESRLALLERRKIKEGIREYELQIGLNHFDDWPQSSCKPLPCPAPFPCIAGRLLKEEAFSILL